MRLGEDTSQTRSKGLSHPLRPMENMPQRRVIERSSATPSGDAKIEAQVSARRTWVLITAKEPSGDGQPPARQDAAQVINGASGTRARLRRPGT